MCLSIKKRCLPLENNNKFVNMGNWWNTWNFFYLRTVTMTCSISGSYRNCITFLRFTCNIQLSKLEWDLINWFIRLQASLKDLCWEFFPRYFFFKNGFHLFCHSRWIFPVTCKCFLWNREHKLQNNFPRQPNRCLI